jgi:endonuclease YncB( thermonuclease family)
MSYLVIGVSDGDTLKVLDESKQQMVCRLYGIDAPEKSQPFGQASKRALSDLTFKRMVEIDVTGRDRYKRSICKVRLGRTDVNREQIYAGMAWMYRQYTKDLSYEAAENTARAQRRGVWSEASAVPPWEYRKNKKLRSPAPAS